MDKEKTNAEYFLKILGYQVKDDITGFTGVATSVSFSINGDVSVLVTPGVDERNKLQEQQWFDINMIETASIRPVLFGPLAITGDYGERNSSPLDHP